VAQGVGPGFKPRYHKKKKKKKKKKKRKKYKMFSLTFIYFFSNMLPF
jgi:hypothetical protein